MMAKKLFLKALIISTLIIVFQLSANAQPGDPDPDAVPLDPGSWVLVAAGVGYGVKKWKENKKNSSDKSDAESEITK